MEILLDKKEDKGLAQLCSYLDVPIRRLANRKGNGIMELILGCAGISSLAEEYTYFFNPYTFNRGYCYNDNFNPEMGMLKICNKIKGDKEILNEFLNEIFRRLYGIDIEYDKLDDIGNTLQLLGYELQVDCQELGYKYSLQYLSIGEMNRQEEMSLMRKNLNVNNPEVLRHYNEAIET